MSIPRWAIALAAAASLQAGTAAAAETDKYDPKGAFTEADENADGKIDPAELYARLTEVFFVGDTNKDGVFDVVEYDMAVALPGNFGKADANGDGKVTLQEFFRERAARWEEADRDQDEALTFEEVEGAWQPRKTQ
jgi:Ca2+-binding EF-hand superfamily protein